MAVSPPGEHLQRRSLPILGRRPIPPPRAVRLSFTDRCDLACVYCRPSRSDGYLERRLDDDAWKVMVRGLVDAGIRRMRITGGEPLLYPRVVEQVAFIASLGVDDLALTTNGTRLKALARPLRDAGLQRLTVSLDSLVPERFWRITRGGRLDRVLEGIDAARAAGFSEIKTNTVVLRGDNDDELAAMVTWAHARDLVPRFIEVMAIGEGARLAPQKLVGEKEMRARLAHLLAEEDGVRDANRGPAKYVRLRSDPRRRVGFITGTTETYCASCDRLRVASDGMIRPCLATADGVAAMPVAQTGNVEGVVSAIAEAWALKPDGETWRGCTEATAATISIRAIGG